MELSDSQILALAIHESGDRVDALGDDGRALGTYQLHNEFRKDWYERPWLVELATIDKQAVKRFADGYYSQFQRAWDELDTAGLTMPLESIALFALCFNQGVHGAVRWLIADAGRNPAYHPYVIKYFEIINHPVLEPRR